MQRPLSAHIPTHLRRPLLLLCPLLCGLLCHVRCASVCAAHGFAAAQDLDRAAIALADAVLVMAPKYAEDSVRADRYTAMVTLAVGQHLQDVRATMRKKTVAPVPLKLWRFSQHKSVGLPGLRYLRYACYWACKRCRKRMCREHQRPKYPGRCRWLTMCSAGR